MSVEAINTKVDLAVAAQETGDYATALTYLRSAAMLLAGISDSQKGDKSLRWDRSAVQNMIAELTRIAAVSTDSATSSRSVVRAKVNYVNPCT